jgi:glycosyltransferase involved in cell wall biosynthesis
MSKKVTFLGYVPNSILPSLYSACEVLVLPSKKEAFGIVLLESLACETPVIATNNGGPRDIIANQEVGFLVNFGDEEELASKILAIIGDRKLYKRLGINGRLLVEREYSW